MRSRPTTSPSFGFSLIELVIVLILMGMVASMATLSMRGVVVRQRLARAAEIVEQFDASLRRAARTDRRGATGSINRSSGRLVVKEIGKTFELPSQVQIEAVRIENGSDQGINARGDGSSQSYALRLSSGGASRWVLLIGGTGQVVHDADKTLIDAVLRGSRTAAVWAVPESESLALCRRVAGLPRVVT